MITYINIGGKERPIGFGYAVAYAYETSTGGNYNELLYRVATEMETAANAANKNDMIGAVTSVHVKPLTDIAYFGLKYAHRVEKVPFDYGPEDVAEWLFSNQQALQECITALFESLPKPSEESQGEAKKKTMKPRPGSNGKGLSKRLQRSA